MYARVLDRDSAEENLLQFDRHCFAECLRALSDNTYIGQRLSRHNFLASVVASLCADDAPQVALHCSSFCRAGRSITVSIAQTVHVEYENEVYTGALCMVWASIGRNTSTTRWSTR